MLYGRTARTELDAELETAESRRGRRVKQSRHVFHSARGLRTCCQLPSPPQLVGHSYAACSAAAAAACAAEQRALARRCAVTRARDAPRDAHSATRASKRARAAQSGGRGRTVPALCPRSPHHLRPAAAHCGSSACRCERRGMRWHALARSACRCKRASSSQARHRDAGRDDGAVLQRATSPRAYFGHAAAGTGTINLRCLRSLSAQ